MFFAINTLARRQRRRLVTLALVLSLASIVVIAHSAMGADHMDGDAVMCVAVLEIAAIAAVAVAAGAPAAVIPLHRAELPAATGGVPLLAFPPQPRARAGPSALQVFRL